MTLIERIEKLAERAVKLSERDARRAESRKLQDLRDKVKPFNRDLGQEVQQLRLLKDEGIYPALDLSEASAAQTRLETLLQRFAAQRNAESLTRGRDWTCFEEAVKTNTRKTSKALKDAWQQYLDNAYTGERPDDLADSLPQTEHNLKQLKAYHTAHDDLRGLRATLPGERADFDRVRDLLRKLNDIAQSFERDVPEAINCFLRAVNAGGADLDLLTTEVMDWLCEQNKSGRFRVVAKDSSS